MSVKIICPFLNWVIRSLRVELILLYILKTFPYHKMVFNSSLLIHGMSFHTVNHPSIESRNLVIGGWRKKGRRRGKERF
jgi:hypothetical protein